MIEVVSYKFLPRDELDGRKIHYYFNVYLNNGNIVEKDAHAIISGTLIGMWNSYLSIESIEVFEESLARLILKIIEREIEKLSIQEILEIHPLTFKYWSQNAPTINFDFNTIENIKGYKIQIDN